VSAVKPGTVFNRALHGECYSRVLATVL